MLALISVFMIVSFLTLVVVVILALAYKCHKCQLVKADIDSCHDNWTTIYNFSKYFLVFMLSVGILSACLKIIIGMYLLVTMKKKLNNPYIKVRYKIMVTMICTVLVMGWNAFFNIFTQDHTFSTLFSIMYISIKHE